MSNFHNFVFNFVRFFDLFFAFSINPCDAFDQIFKSHNESEKWKENSVSKWYCHAKIIDLALVRRILEYEKTSKHE